MNWPFETMTNIPLVLFPFPFFFLHFLNCCSHNSCIADNSSLQVIQLHLPVVNQIAIFLFTDPVETHPA